MAGVPTPEEAVERARQAQEQRLKAIQSLAEARQNIVDVREKTERERAELETRIAGRINDAERDDVRAYNAALSAGWSTTELRKIGFPEPQKKKRAARARRRASTTGKTNGTTSRPTTESSTPSMGTPTMSESPAEASIAEAIAARPIAAFSSAETNVA